MSNETLTAVEALDEVLNRLFGGAPDMGWREELRVANVEPRDPDEAKIVLRGGITYGDLRRWSAPLLKRNET